MNDFNNVGFLSKDNCTCCGLCYDLCPKQAINLTHKRDKWFLYPEINNDICVNCGTCVRFCPSFHHSLNNVKQSYVIRDNDKQKRMMSSSGGAFGLICDAFLKTYLKCAVFGVEWDTFLNPIYSFAEDCVSLQKYHKSKYIQADTKGLYKKIRELIKSQYHILFFGTPCVCASVSNFLSEKEKEMITIVDIICHGVPSIKMWEKYKKEEVANITQYSFRNKSPVFGIRDSTTAFYSSGKKKIYISYHNDAFLRAYYDRISYRDSCYRCQYAQIKRVGDLTIGDAWHIDRVYPDLNADDGVSSILINSERGAIIFSKIQGSDIRPIKIDFLCNNNEALQSPTIMPEARNSFLKALDKTTFKRAAFKYSNSRYSKITRFFPLWLILYLKNRRERQ